MSEKIVTLSNLTEFKSKCDQTYATMEDSGIINLGYLYVDNVGSSTAWFSKTLTAEEVASIPQTGIAIFMFNTTCVMFPYVVGQFNRFVCSAVYNDAGSSVITRGRMTLSTASGDGGDPFVQVLFAPEFASLYSIPGQAPYGIIRFIGL